MKFENYFGLSRPALVAKTLISGVALSALLGLSLNVQAQTCTIGNWDGAEGLTNANTGTQGANNRRYGGPCGLRVQLDGTPRFLTDDSPAAESTYIARFYAFLNNATEETIIFSAEGGNGDEVQVRYNFPGAGDLTLTVFDQGGTAQDLTYNSIGSGWHSIELVWEASATAQIAFKLNTEDDLTATIDTSGIALTAANLGNINGASNGSIDFDDFDSRRQTRPGRLLVGDANNSGAVNILDVQTVGAEVVSGIFAPGQPDCNEDGAINILDVQCVGSIVVN